MTRESFQLVIDVPDPAVVARVVEVQCGASYVVIKQIMGRADDEWTVYESGCVGGGLVGKIDAAPRAASAEELLPWASTLVTHRERDRLARTEVAKLMNQAAEQQGS